MQGIQHLVNHIGLQLATYSSSAPEARATVPGNESQDVF